MGTLTVGISASADDKIPLVKFPDELVHDSQSFRCASPVQWTWETLKEVHIYLTPSIPEVPATQRSCFNYKINKIRHHIQ